MMLLNLDEKKLAKECNRLEGCRVWHSIRRFTMKKFINSLPKLSRIRQTIRNSRSMKSVFGLDESMQHDTCLLQNVYA